MFYTCYGDTPTCEMGYGWKETSIYFHLLWTFKVIWWFWILCSVDHQCVVGHSHQHCCCEAFLLDWHSVCFGSFTVLWTILEVEVIKLETFLILKMADIFFSLCSSVWFCVVVADVVVWLLICYYCIVLDFYIGDLEMLFEFLFKKSRRFFQSGKLSI